MLARTFHSGEPLTSSQVYCAAIGIFKSKNWQLIDTIIDETNTVPGDISEKARIYHNKSNGKYHIIYLPGIDNNRNDSTAESLKKIKNFVDDRFKLIDEVNQRVIDTDNLTRSYFIAEKNFISFPIIGKIHVAHFIYAESSPTGMKLIDSISRWKKYNLNYIKDLLFSNADVPLTERANQNEIFDHWSCGHHVLQELKYSLNNSKQPSKKITAEIVDKHNHYYQIGSQIVKRKSAYPDELASEKVSLISFKARPTGEASPGFFDKHPRIKSALKYGLIGAAITLLAAGLIVGTVFTAGALPASLGIAAALAFVAGPAMSGIAVAGATIAVYIVPAVSLSAYAAFSIGAGVIAAGVGIISAGLKTIFNAMKSNAHREPPTRQEKPNVRISNSHTHVLRRSRDNMENGFIVTGDVKPMIAPNDHAREQARDEILTVDPSKASKAKENISTLHM